METIPGRVDDFEDRVKFLAQNFMRYLVSTTDNGRFQSYIDRDPVPARDIQRSDENSYEVIVDGQTLRSIVSSASPAICAEARKTLKLRWVDDACLEIDIRRPNDTTRYFAVCRIRLGPIMRGTRRFHQVFGRQARLSPSFNVHVRFLQSPMFLWLYRQLEQAALTLFRGAPVAVPPPPASPSPAPPPAALVPDHPLYTLIPRDALNNIREFGCSQDDCVYGERGSIHRRLRCGPDGGRNLCCTLREQGNSELVEHIAAMKDVNVQNRTDRMIFGLGGGIPFRLAEKLSSFWSTNAPHHFPRETMMRAFAHYVQPSNIRVRRVMRRNKNLFDYFLLPTIQGASDGLPEPDHNLMTEVVQFEFCTTVRMHEDNASSPAMMLDVYTLFGIVFVPAAMSNDNADQRARECQKMIRRVLHNMRSLADECPPIR